MRNYNVVCFRLAVDVALSLYVAYTLQSVALGATLCLVALTMFSFHFRVNSAALAAEDYRKMIVRMQEQQGESLARVGKVYARFAKIVEEAEQLVEEAERQGDEEQSIDDLLRGDDDETV